MSGRWITVALLALTAGAVAQPLRPTPIDPRVWRDLVKALQPGVAETERNENNGVGQALASSGREDLVFYFPPREGTPACKPLLQGGKPVDPVAYIAEAARKAPITMIGEGHAAPRTRAFIGQVAAALRAEGYTAYAAETFEPNIGEKSPAIPLVTDGYYTKEPAYGRLIRRLRGLGYPLFAYEADFNKIDPKLSLREQMAQRGAMQAAGLQAVMKRAGGKLLVHAGEGNHSERSIPASDATMGARFAQASGLDPLTISRARVAGGAMVVCDPTAYAAMPHNFDIRIGFPELKFERGRPAWRVEAGDRFAEIPTSMRRADQIAVYEARPAGERADSTPMERLLLRPGESLPLLLPPGRYDLSVWTEKDGWSAATPLTVTPN